MSCRVDASERIVHRTAWMLLGTLIFVMWVPSLAVRGMTWDGVLYATISRNIAAGACDAWHPMVSATFMRHFHEHPPLAFWLEAVFFRVFGDHFWVERLYGICTALVTGAILMAIWRQLLREVPRGAASSWLPALLWFSSCYWSYRHNILENTLGIFTALSVYASLRALTSTRGWAAWSALAGLAITAALLAKGPVGLFPAVTPAIAWMTLRRAGATTGLTIGSQRAALVQACVLGCCFCSLALVLLPAVSREYLGTYWHQQVLASVTGRREGVRALSGHLKILLLLARSLQIAVLLTGIVLLAARLAPKTPRIDREPRQTGAAWFCLLTALSASLPLIACPKQHGHYTAPSWPFYAFALALWCLPALTALLPRLAWLGAARPQALLRCGMASAMAVALVYAVGHYGLPFRDQQIIQMSDQVAQAAGPHATVAVTPESWNRLADYEQFNLHAYLYRDHYISLWVEQPSTVPVHLRLTPPDAHMTVSYEQIVTDNGFECHPLAGGAILTADRAGRLR
jgi:4-amino-4-deoxy-L-arabinose transferase-like glycosyltransferase